MLKTISIDSSKYVDWLTHTVFISEFCPISKTPLTGSYIDITYSPDKTAIDILTIESYINSFKNNTIYRDLEMVISKISEDVNSLIGVKVDVMGYFVISDNQIFTASATCG